MINSHLEIYKGKKVLVTGNRGFKGSWLSLWLKELQADILGFSLGPPSQPNMFETLNLGEKITSAYGDIGDKDYKDALDFRFENFKPEIVFHLAAQPIMRKSIKEPVLTFSTNLMGTVNVLEASRNCPSVKTVVAITSDKCYKDNPKPNGYSETDRLGGDDPYSTSKACAEHAINAYRKSYGLNVASCRAGNILGGGDWGEDRLLPDCITKLSYGQKITIRNPLHLRPWQFVLDPLYGYLLLGSKLLEDKKYAQAWNFGPLIENYINVEELVRKTIKYWGSGEYEIVPNPEISESQFLRLNCEKSNNLLGWKPKYNINETLEKTISWYKNFYDKKDMYEFSLNQIKEYMES